MTALIYTHSPGLVNTIEIMTGFGRRRGCDGWGCGRLALSNFVNVHTLHLCHTGLV